ncbi:MAG: NAD-dependent epimerase/dehydratase family protein [Zoogloeaceae bacterium]|nr:NAD-dependent epimerase/dehydratase family protein [Zoogloeaceae bacterium]
MKKAVLIVGCGDVARRMIPWLVRRFRVFALIRREQDRAQLRAMGVCPLIGDLDDRRSLRRLAGLADYVIHAAPPAANGLFDLRTRHLIAALRCGKSLPQAMTYIGTTGVYGDHSGRWLDESQPVAPTTPRAVRRVDAERVLRGLARECGVRVAILRAPGIYAADRLPTERLRRADPVLVPDEDVFTNHIHAEDLARLTCLALFRGRAGRCYNAVDSSALPMGAYFDLVADTLGMPRPPRVSRVEIASRLSPMALSFLGESRRIRNRRIHDELRHRLIFPTIADGLRAIATDPHLP